MSNVTKVTVPDIGGATDVEVIEVSAKQGDMLDVEDSIITLESDKASMEIPSPVSGVITQWHIAVGDKVEEGTLICEVETQSADLSSQQEPQQEPQQNSEPAAEPVSAPVAKQASNQILQVPDIGTDGEVEVIEVSVSVGDELDLDDSIITLESDKASMEVPATTTGRVTQVFVKVGDKVSQGRDMVEVSVSGSEPAAAPATTPEAKPATKPEAKSEAKPAAKSAPVANKPVSREVGSSSGQAVLASPSVRRLARELGVVIEKVSGSGRKQRIVKDDVKAYVKQIMTEGVASGANNQASSGFNFPPMPDVDFSSFGPTKSQPLSRIKKLSSRYLHRNWVQIPHVTQFDEADITELEEFRKSQKANVERQGFKLTPLAFIMKAVMATLKQFPNFNSSLANDGETLIVKQYYNIGVAVNTDGGLVVPVVRDCDKKSVFELAEELGTLSARARDGKLTKNDLQGSTFSISSLGGLGGTAFTPIINAPDVAILGVSKSEIKPKFNQGEWEPKLMLPLSLSYDHRVIDGAEAAQFVTALAKRLADIRLLVL